MFRFDFEDEDADIQEYEEQEYKEYDIDFETGFLTGQIVSGADAVKVWAWIALQISRYNYEQYTWDYGSDLDTLIGQTADQEYIKMEAARMIRDCLKVNDHIQEVSEIECVIEDDRIILQKCVLETDYGEVALIV